MREIKSRGMSKGTEHWVYGVYHKHQNITPSPIISKGETTEPIGYTHLIIADGFSDWGMPKPIYSYQVNPETVGQYTGLKDKNGKEIFEGDIVIDPWGSVSEVIWVDESAMFTYDDNVSIYFPTYMWCKSYEHDTQIHNQTFVRPEIIGNIYQNPELLEGGLTCPK